MHSKGRLSRVHGIQPPWIAVLVCLFITCLSTSGNVRADFFQDYMIDPEDGHLDASRYLSEQPMGFLPVPIIITEPAVGNGLGLMGIFFHENREQKQQRLSTIRETGKAILPANISVVGGMGTENGTRGLMLGHLGFWQQDRIRYTGFLLLPDGYLDFYSLGELELPRGVELNLEGPVVYQELKARITPDSNWFAGARQLYRKVDLSLANAQDLAPFDSPALNDRFQALLAEQSGVDITTSGLGLVTEYDSRNNPFNPETGYLFSGRYQWFDDSIGSDVDYEDYTLEGLGYWQLPYRLRLGLRAEFQGVEARGDNRLPPYAYPFIDMRGIPAVRYQGDRVAEAEVELGWQIDPRWKVSVFAGTGRTAENFGDLNDADPVNSWGTGFRYLIARRYGFTMGIDIARGPEDTAFYIQAGSSWR